jgi:hypothetical protein
MNHIIYIDEEALNKETEKNLTLPHNAPAIENKKDPSHQGRRPAN